MKQDIFEFNHIDNLLSKEEIKTIKEFYKYYHKKFWCFKETFKHFKILDESITISGILLVIIGTISGGLTLNPIILGVINGVGILLTNFGKMKNYKKKIEMTKIAFTTYDKVLVELRSAMRGDEFEKNQFIDKMKVVDAMIIDQTPLADKYVKQYEKNGNKFLYLLLIKMLKSIIGYVNYNYQLCENIDSPFLTKDMDANDCYIKSCLVYKKLHEIYSRNNITLKEVMTIMDLSGFLFFSNSSVLKNHLIFHHAFKTFWKQHRKGRPYVYVFDTTIRSSVLGFVTGVLYCFFHKGVV